MPSASLLALCLLPTSVLPAPQEVEAAAEPATEFVRAVAISPDGQRIAAGHSDGKVELLRAETGEALAVLEPVLSDDVWNLAFSPDGARLAGLGHDGKLVLWKLGDGGEMVRVAGPLDALPAHGEVMHDFPFGSELSWSPTGERLIAGDTSGANSLWSPEGELILRWTVSDPRGDPQLVWSSDGERLLTADGSELQVRSAKTGALLGDGDGPARIQCTQPIVAVALHPDGQLAATGHVNSTLKLWSLESGELLFEQQYLDRFIPEEEDEVAAIAFSPSGAQMALSIREGSHVWIVDVETKQRLWVSEFLGAHFFEVMQLRWSPDSSRLWFVFQCGRARLYCVNPAAGGKPTVIDDANPPQFGASRGVILSGRQIGLVDYGGRRLPF